MVTNLRKRTHSRAFGSKSALFVAAAILCALPAGSSGGSVPPEHMRRDLPKGLSRRDVSNGTVSITVSNNCTEDIYPGISTQNGNPPSENGFLLQPGQSQMVTVSSNWQGRIWPRTNCSFPNNNAPNKACNTGDCAGALNCTVSVSYNLRNSV
jgi:Thaumatin family